MRKRDKLYKEYAQKKDTAIYNMYKIYRNMIITLLRRSKKNHYVAYFIEHQSNMKKTWDGIKGLINISKKKTGQINKLLSSNISINR